MKPIKILYKIQLIKNVSDPFDKEDEYACISCGNIVDESNRYNEYCNLLDMAYNDIMSGKIKFDNIPHFSPFYVVPYERHSHSIRYVVNGSHDTVNIIFATSLSAEFYADGTVRFNDSDYVASRFNDKLYLVDCTDRHRDNGFGTVIMEFEGSISEEDLIRAVEKYLEDNVYILDE